MDIKDYLARKRDQVETALDRFLPQPEGPLAGHIEAMRYSLFAGGKRLRPILCLAAAEAVGGGGEGLLPVATALECIHTYSLIHDDLPAMDNDDLRRGMPTSHKKFGEAEAILAGDGLLSFAFELLSSPEMGKTIAPERQVRIINLVATAIGPQGMVGGQALDIAAEGKRIDLEELQRIHRCKTGALITAAVQAGALAGGSDQQQLKALSRYGDLIGLAFQIVDDLLDVEGTTERLGKATGSDAARGKATYPAFFGVEKTRRLARETADQAAAALDGLGGTAEPLRALARYVYTRSH